MAKPKRSRSLPVDLDVWKVCLAALKANVADFPYLAAEIAALEANIATIEKDNAIQEKLKAQLAVQTDKVEDNRGKTVKIYSTIMFHVRGKYGPKSPKIKEFLPTGEGRITASRKKKA